MPGIKLLSIDHWLRPVQFNDLLTHQFVPNMHLYMTIPTKLSPTGGPHGGCQRAGVAFAESPPRCPAVLLAHVPQQLLQQGPEVSQGLAANVSRGSTAHHTGRQAL